jgi:hypothetical protein
MKQTGCSSVQGRLHVTFELANDFSTQESIHKHLYTMQSLNAAGCDVQFLEAHLCS